MVATDGPEPVKRAVHTAIKIAKFSEAKLYAVYVIELGVKFVKSNIISYK